MKLLWDPIRKALDAAINNDDAIRDWFTKAASDKADMYELIQRLPADDVRRLIPDCTSSSSGLEYHRN